MSAEFPVTNWGLGNCLQYTSEVMTEMRETSAKIADEPLTIGIFLSALAAFAASTGSALTSREGSYPLTVCPLPGDAEMATAMQLLGYEYLRHHSPDRLRRDLIGVPMSVIKDVYEWLVFLQKCMIDLPTTDHWEPSSLPDIEKSIAQLKIFMNGEDDGESTAKAGI